MKVLQLCFVSNFWPSHFQVNSIDLKTGGNVLDLPDNFGSNFDLIVSAPPCDQFTKANSLNWEQSPDYFVSVALKCLKISELSGKPWLLENPPGRISVFIPDLLKYRIATWHGLVTNKEYVVYSNTLFLFNYTPRYGKPGSILNYSKSKRELWQLDFFNEIFPFLVNSVLCFSILFCHG